VGFVDHPQRRLRCGQAPQYVALRQLFRGKEHVVELALGPSLRRSRCGRWFRSCCSVLAIPQHLPVPRPDHVGEIRGLITTVSTSRSDRDLVDRGFPGAGRHYGECVPSLHHCRHRFRRWASRSRSGRPHSSRRRWRTPRPARVDDAGHHQIQGLVQIDRQGQRCRHPGHHSHQGTVKRRVPGQLPSRADRRRLTLSLPLAHMSQGRNGVLSV
jgi:hypothetical protein